MADLQKNDIVGDDSAAPESHEQKGGKKKKKKRGCGFFILLLLVAVGVAVGLQASGGMDFRPLVYSTVPKLPIIGPQAASLLGIPEIYSLTVEERRKIELDEQERAIASARRSLDEAENRLRDVSNDLSLRGEELDAALAEVAQRLEALSDDALRKGQGGANGQDKDEIRNIIRTFEEMSPKSAAAILEKLDKSLAVAVLDGLAEDFRAKAMGKMEAELAAELMEQLTALQRSRN